MKVKHLVGKIRKAIMVGNSKRKLKKIFKKAKKISGFDMQTMIENPYGYNDEINCLSNDLKTSLKNKYTGLFSKDGVGKYLDNTNPHDLLIQFFGNKYYGPHNMSERDKVLRETLPDRRTYYEKKLEKQTDKIRKSLIKNKDEVRKIAFEKGHKWNFESALKGIKRDGNKLEEYSLRLPKEVTRNI